MRAWTSPRTKKSSMESARNDFIRITESRIKYDFSSIDLYICTFPIWNNLMKFRLHNAISRDFRELKFRKIDSASARLWLMTNFVCVANWIHWWRAIAINILTNEAYRNEPEPSTPRRTEDEQINRYKKWKDEQKKSGRPQIKFQFTRVVCAPLMADDVWHYLSRAKCVMCVCVYPELVWIVEIEKRLPWMHG